MQTAEIFWFFVFSCQKNCFISRVSSGVIIGFLAFWSCIRCPVTLHCHFWPNTTSEALCSLYSQPLLFSECHVINSLYLHSWKCILSWIIATMLHHWLDVGCGVLLWTGQKQQCRVWYSCHVEYLNIPLDLLLFHLSAHKRPKQVIAP